MTYLGKKDVFEIRSTHHSIKTASNQSFLVIARNRQKERSEKFLVKKLCELKVGDEIVVLKKLKDCTSYRFKKLKISKKGDYKVNKINSVSIPSQTNAELVEFLGLFIGDGWVRVQKAEIG